MGASSNTKGDDNHSGRRGFKMLEDGIDRSKAPGSFQESLQPLIRDAAASVMSQAGVLCCVLQDRTEPCCGRVGIGAVTCSCEAGSAQYTQARQKSNCDLCGGICCCRKARGKTGLSWHSSCLHDEVVEGRPLTCSKKTRQLVTNASWIDDIRDQQKWRH